jgi:hypothetical protein
MAGQNADADSELNRFLESLLDPVLNDFLLEHNQADVQPDQAANGHALAGVPQQPMVIDLQQPAMQMQLRHQQAPPMINPQYPQPAQAMPTHHPKRLDESQVTMPRQPRHHIISDRGDADPATPIPTNAGNDGRLVVNCATPTAGHASPRRSVAGGDDTPTDAGQCAGGVRCPTQQQHSDAIAGEAERATSSSLPWTAISVSVPSPAVGTPAALMFNPFPGNVHVSASTP